MRRAVMLGLALIWACGDDDGPPLDGSVDLGDRPVDAANAPDLTDEADAQAPDGGPVATARTMWVSVGAEPRLATVELGIDGAMSARPAADVTLPARPGAMTYGRATQRLYVGLNDGRIGTIDLAADVVLEATPGTGNPVYLALDASESTLVSAYFGDDRLRAHDVTGAPPFDETSALGTADEPHAAARGPNGLFYVPHRNGDAIHWYSLAADGSLALEGQVAASAGEGPRHIAFHPSGDYAYVIMEYADSVVLHDVGADGSLTRRESYPTLPAGADGDANTCADVHVTLDGRALYGSNRGHDSLAMFAIAGDGTLSSLGTIPTEARPREFALSPDGRFVVAAGQDSGFLQSYRVEPDGTLTSLDRLQVGDDLRWVVID